MHIKNINITVSYRCLQAGTTIDLEQITLLVGEQGTGKSTILDALASISQGKCPKYISTELTEKAMAEGVDCFYFNTEKDNPRVKDAQLYSTPSGQDKGIGTRAALMSRFQSHGEVIKAFTIDPITEAKDCILLIDEPESGLSIRNQYLLSRTIHEAAQRNVQFIVATHCIPLIESVNKVYSLEHREWLPPEEFINRSRF